MTGTMVKLPRAGCITCTDLGSVGSQDWSENLSNVGQLHLYTVLVLVSLNAHHLKLPCKKGKLLVGPWPSPPTSLKELLVDLPVDGEVPERCLVGGALCEGTG